MNTEAFVEGYEAYHEDLPLSANPYGSDPERKRWFAGWYTAQDEDVD